METLIGLLRVQLIFAADAQHAHTSRNNTEETKVKTKHYNLS